MNARTAMNYATIAPIVERMQPDPRLEFYFTASENPSLTEQKMLLGRYRMADAETQRWVRQTIAEHLERHIPELAG